jgi:hypothetical protein
MKQEQNIYTVSDSVHCPYGEGEIITNYLNDLFTRVSSDIVKLGQPVDWLIVKSDSLEDVTFSSHSFFEELLEKKLKEHDKDISVLKGHSRAFGGAIGNHTIREWIYDTLNPKKLLDLNYLNNPWLKTSFVGYHLDMPSEKD